MGNALWPLIAAVSLLVSAALPLEDAKFVSARQAMVERISHQDPSHPIQDPNLLDALREVPRQLFVPKRHASKAYADVQLSIGKGQRLSEPFVIAYMTQTLEPKPTDRVLEIGTGSGYQTALLSRLTKEVYSIEIYPALAKRAQKVLADLGYSNVQVRVGDGYRGWPEKAPFDAIIVTCKPDHIPEPLVDQLAMGGRLVIPVGVSKTSQLVVVRKTEKGLVEEKRLSVDVLPMKGEAVRKPR